MRLVPVDRNVSRVHPDELLQPLVPENRERGGVVELGSGRKWNEPIVSLLGVPVFAIGRAEPGFFGIRLLSESNRHEFTVTRRDLRLPSQTCSCTKL